MKKTVLILTIISALMLGLSACQRSASKTPNITPEVNEELNAHLSVDQQIIAATHTAQAIAMDFNLATQIVPNALGTPVAITPIPPTPIPSPTPTNPPTPTMMALSRPQTWAVQSGETVYCLARRFDVDPDEMLALNGLNNYSMLYIGQELRVPQSGEWPGERQILSHPDTWDVSRGETVYEIACAYGDLWPEHIIQVNGLKEPYDLSDIAELNIP